MSAYIAVLQSDAAYLLADRAVYHGNGVVARFEDKVIAVPHLKAAITSRGMLSLFSNVNLMLLSIGAKTIDDLVLRLMNYAEKEEAHTMRTQPDCPDPGIELTGVFWGEEGSEGFQISNKTYGSFEPKRLPAMRGSPDCDITALPQPILSMDDVAKLTMPGDGLAVMELQRATKHKCWTGPAYIVGGGCDCATVTAAGVTIERLVDWPDEVGQRIQP